MTDASFLCLDRVVPLALASVADDLAARERPDNAGRILEATGQPARYWRPGRTLRVRFLAPPHPRLPAVVLEAAAAWTQHADLTFRPVTGGPAEIRVTFTGGGNWSALGTDALAVPGEEPTMCLAEIPRAASSTRVARIVRHEFGHAIGLVHEHQSPEAGLDWDRERVFADLTAPEIGWTPAQVETEVLAVYDRSMTNGTAFDAHSVMLYPVPPSWTVSGRTHAANHELSELDASFARSIYPGRRSILGFTRVRRTGGAL